MSAIGMCGTFDVENYGDLLFPLIAAHELRQRLGPISLQCFSYSAKRLPQWPLEVTSSADLAETVDRLRGMIVGGGHIIRADKSIAPGYFPPNEQLHHPLSIWLTPMLLALEQGLPVVWNAPGVHEPIPAWVAPLLTAALVASDYVSVRDESSLRALTALAPAIEIAVVPDSAFGIVNLCNPEKPSVEYVALCQRIGLQRPYLIVQASVGMETVVRALADRRNSFDAYQILVLSISPVHGDANEVITGRLLPGALTLPQWPHPLLLAELIGHAEAVIGISLHLAITALAYGVPVLRRDESEPGKYDVLEQFATVYSIAEGSDVSPDWLRSKLGRTAPSAAARNANHALKIHWDRIAAAFETSPARVVPRALRELWQTLPAALESGDVLAMKLSEAQRRIGDLHAENIALRQSLSWRLTSPLRRLLDVVQRQRSRPLSLKPAPIQQCVMHFEAIERQKLLRQPYAWASVGELFSSQHAANLAATFPRDHFKIVQGYDNEKDYAYHARALIGMGSNAISHVGELSPVWRQLATDLLSHRYRAAMSQLTGIDLSKLRMEVNVFHYGPGAWLGPHVDLADKVVTHVLYFNLSWNIADGGCLNILRSEDMNDSACIVAPIVGSSAVLVRSNKSWHAVSRVNPACAASRRSITVTFYRDGAVSTMWPPGDNTPTFAYVEAETSA